MKIEKQKNALNLIDLVKMRIPPVSSARISMPSIRMGMPRVANRLRVVWENFKV